MNRWLHIFTACFAFAACSGSADEPNNSSTTTTLSSALSAGLYEDTDLDASLALWISGEAVDGVLAATDDEAFALTVVGGAATLSPLVGACAGCPDATWDIDIVAQDGALTLTVVSGPSIGFTSWRMVPHDGFKPEFKAASGSEVWTGRVVAASADLDPVMLARACEISRNLDTGSITSLSCLGVDTDAGWTAERADSWMADGDAVSFETTSGVQYRGEVVDDTFTGEVAVGDTTIGRFHFTRL